MAGTHLTSDSHKTNSSSQDRIICLSNSTSAWQPRNSSKQNDPYEMVTKLPVQTLEDANLNVVDVVAGTYTHAIFHPVCSEKGGSPSRIHTSEYGDGVCHVTATFQQGFCGDALHRVRYVPRVPHPVGATMK